MEAGARGVRSASWIMVRLPHEVAPLFREWLDVHFPDRAGKVMHIIQSMRGGKDYEASFHTRMKPKGVWADLVRTRFRLGVRGRGLHRTGSIWTANSFARLRAMGRWICFDWGFEGGGGPRT
jgi:DNA repair photolyase